LLPRQWDRSGLKRSTKDKAVSEDPTEPKILRPRNRVRYLKLIALFKIGKGILLLVIGFSVLFLNARTGWLDSMSDWAADEILLKHSRVVVYLLAKLQDVLAGGALRATGFLALFYAGVLFTEGIGVYLQKRWAEYFMVFATGALIPLELRHIYYRPSVAAVTILLINCFIVWFLYRVLRREPARVSTRPSEVAVETR
jgi:uncharacterized membrane protein (DUF2068 family)